MNFLSGLPTDVNFDPRVYKACLCTVPIPPDPMAAKFELPLTQPSTLVAIVCTLLVAVAATFGLELSGDWKGLMEGLLKLVHLGSFSTWLGVQVWVTFFAGLTMYRHLPRHTFGFIQGKLFPKYFMLGTVLSSLSLLTYVVHVPPHAWSSQQMIAGCSLVVTLLMAMSNLLYLEPQTTKCKITKHKYEKEISAGQAIGKVEEDKLTQLRKIPEYVVLEKRFISLHTYSAIANLVSLATTAVHLWHLSCYLSSI